MGNLKVLIATCNFGEIDEYFAPVKQNGNVVVKHKKTI